MCLRTSEKLSVGSELLSFVTVDFYNHDTQHSSVVDGFNNAYNFQASFKVKMDEFFISFLKERYLKIEFYCVLQQNAELLGTANIPLSQLITENANPNVSAVVELDTKIRSARKGAHE